MQTCVNYFNFMLIISSYHVSNKEKNSKFCPHELPRALPWSPHFLRLERHRGGGLAMAHQLQRRTEKTQGPAPEGSGSQLPAGDQPVSFLFKQPLLSLAL